MNTIKPPVITSSSSLSLRWLAHAPHRLMFFIGASNLLLAMTWWALWLASMRFGLWPMRQTTLYAGWLHAFIMQYLVLPSFFFGFLLTVFPRWMNLPELQRIHYLPIGIGLMGGQLLMLLATFGLFSWGITTGLLLAFIGWSYALLVLGQLVYKEIGRTWHARSCFAALLIGWLGLVLFITAVFDLLPAQSILISLKLGGFGLLLPVYITVAHRMFPFFAANVVQGYKPWRPLSWLAGMWGFIAVHLVLELTVLREWLWLADLPLLLLSSWALYRWWPRGIVSKNVPGLLAVLFLGTLWLPITFALYFMQSVVLFLTGNSILGHAPLHALVVGFFTSILIAMVTRVSHGHSGRKLMMPRIAWFSFIAIQGIALIRIAADIMYDPYMWHSLAAFGWLLVLAPWVFYIGKIYLTPRIDGRDG